MLVIHSRFNLLHMLIFALCSLPFSALNVLASNDFEDVIDAWAVGYARIMGAEKYHVDFSGLNVTYEGPPYYAENRTFLTGTRRLLGRDTQLFENNRDFNYKFHLERKVTASLDETWSLESGFRKGTTSGINLRLPIPYSTSAFDLKKDWTREIISNKIDEQKMSRQISRTMSIDIDVPPHENGQVFYQIEGDEVQSSLVTPFLLSGGILLGMGPIPIGGKLSKNYHYITQQRRPIGPCRLFGDTVKIEFPITEVLYGNFPFKDDHDFVGFFPNALSHSPNNLQYYSYVNMNAVRFLSITNTKYITNIIGRTILQ